MNPFAEAMKVRTKKFLLNVLDLVERLPSGDGPREIGKQLVRAGAGVAGNYRSACRSRSHAEFTARIGIVLEETDESELWLEVLDERAWGPHALRDSVLAESRALRAIFVSSNVTARQRQPSRRQVSHP
jgi:four helix bundle protein